MSSPKSYNIDRTEEELGTTLQGVKEEGSKSTLWDNPPILPIYVRNNNSHVQIAANVSSATAVDALSTQMVTNIMHEVTKSNTGPETAPIILGSPNAELFRQGSEAVFMVSLSDNFLNGKP